jgi:hypothetical protein
MNHREYNTPRNERSGHEKYLDARARNGVGARRGIPPKAFAVRAALELLRHNVLASLAIPPLRCANGFGWFASEIAPRVMQAQRMSQAVVVRMMVHSIGLRFQLNGHLPRFTRNVRLRDPSLSVSIATG